MLLHSNKTWKYEEGYMSSDESTTDPEDVDLDDIDASSLTAGASVSTLHETVSSSLIFANVGTSVSA